MANYQNKQIDQNLITPDITKFLKSPTKRPVEKPMNRSVGGSIKKSTRGPTKKSARGSIKKSTSKPKNNTNTRDIIDFIKSKSKTKNVGRPKKNKSRTISEEVKRLDPDIILNGSS